MANLILTFNHMQAPTQQARDWVHTHVMARDRVECPACEKVVGLTRHILDHWAARDLIHMVRRTQPGEWMHIRDFFPGSEAGRKHPKLRYWGMAETHPNTDPKKKNSGKWRVTQTGRDFAMVQIWARRIIWTYNKEVVDMCDPSDKVSIVDALGTSFDFQELMYG